MNLFESMRKEVGHGGIVPRGWEMAWYEPRRRLGVYFPVPLNWLLRLAREIKYRVQMALYAPAIEHAQVFEMQRTHRERERLAEEYARGYMYGWRECFQVCVEAVEDEIAHADQMCDQSLWLDAEPKPRPKN